MQKKRCYGKNGYLITDNIVKNAYVQYDEGFYMQEHDGADESFVVSPWVDKVKPPSNFVKPPDQNLSKPSFKFEPEYCYGYRIK